MGLETRQLYKDRFEAAVELWDKIMRGEITTRTQLEEMLYIVYKRRNIEPFRGLSKVRIYDKEIATVYVVGKYGLGLVDEDNVGTFKGIFTVEVPCDEAFGLLRSRGYRLSEEDSSRVRGYIDNPALGEGLEERVFRFMRFVFTGTIMGFFGEVDFVNSYRVLLTIFNELESRLINYVRFYVAFKVAEQIALGQIRTPDEKKITKYAYCVKLNVDRCVPSERLIREVAVRVYGVPRRVVDRLFPNEGKSFIPRAGG